MALPCPKGGAQHESAQHHGGGDAASAGEALGVGEVAAFAPGVNLFLYFLCFKSSKQQKFLEGVGKVTG